MSRRKRPATFFGYRCGDYYSRDDHSEVLAVTFGLETPVDCTREARLLSVNYIYGSPYCEEDFKDDPRSEVRVLIGLDSAFEDSPQIYACTPPHLGRLLHGLIRGKQGDEYFQYPDVIADPSGKVQEELYFELLRQYLGIRLPKNYFARKSYSQGKETPLEFWEHEKDRWIG